MFGIMGHSKAPARSGQGGRGWIVDRVVIILEGDEGLAPGQVPLMLETILHRSALERAVEQCMADGAQRFFLVCPEGFASQAAACFPPAAAVTISQSHEELMAFLDTPEEVLVLCRSAVPVAEAGPGFAYCASGRELRQVWRERMTNQIAGARLVPGWLPLLNRETLEEVRALFRRRDRTHGGSVPG